MGVTLVQNNKGQSLVQALISIGIMAIAVGVFATMMSSQQRETRSLSEYLSSMDLQKTLTAALANGSVCSYILNNPTVLTFDATLVSPTTPQILTPSLPLYASIDLGPPLITGPVVAQVNERASVYSNTLYVKSITLGVSGAPSPMPSPGPGGTFTGNWIIAFDSSKAVRPVKPLKVSTTLIVDTTTPTAAKVTGCMLDQPRAATSRFTSLNSSQRISLPMGSVDMKAALPANLQDASAVLVTCCGPQTDIDGNPVSYYSGFDQASCATVMVSAEVHTLSAPRAGSWCGITGVLK